MLVIIDPSTRHPERQVCATIFHQSPCKTVIVRPALSIELHQQLPESLPLALQLSEETVVESFKDLPPHEVEAVIILGGGASPAEEIEWQTKLKQWLTDPQGPMKRECPILGVCYGHQLLGTLAGGSVEFLWEGVCAKGVRSVTLTEPTLGLQEAHSYPLIVSHREGLRSVPQGWVNLSTHETLVPPTGCHTVQAVEVMRHEEYPWWGFQAHVDATEAFLINNHIDETLPQSYAGATVVKSFLALIARSQQGNMDR